MNREDFAHLSDDELAVEHLLACAEHARLQGERLREFGFSPELVAGQDALVWRSSTGQLYTTTAAIVAVTPPDFIPEDKEDS